jgi:drug/metabolite transporter (DMT)-like permease
MIRFVSMDRIGELAALGTAVFWTITALSFESAGRKVGSLAVNIVRLVAALLLFSGYSLAVGGSPLPDAGGEAWVWLSISGFVGFVIGDLLLFQAFVEIGARIAMLVYSSVPPLTALLGRLVLGETLTTPGFIGMALTVGGIALVVTKKRAQEPEPVVAVGPDAGAVPSIESSDAQPLGADISSVAIPPTDQRGFEPKPHGTQSLARGVLLALGGSIGQAAGLVLSKLGAGTTLDPFAATQIRVISGVVGFSILFTILHRWQAVGRALTNRQAMIRIGTGAFFGPFLGVSLGLFAAQHSTTGIAATIIALVPVLIIPPSILLLGEKVTPREVVGAVVAVAGVAVLFL